MTNREYVVCTLRTPWYSVRTRRKMPDGPTYGKVYTVQARKVLASGVAVLCVAEFTPVWFVARHFKPVERDLRVVFQKQHVPLDKEIDA